MKMHTAFYLGHDFILNKDIALSLGTGNHGWLHLHGERIPKKLETGKPPLVWTLLAVPWVSKQRGSISSTGGFE